MDTNGSGEHYLIYGSGRLSVAVVRELLKARPGASIALVADQPTAAKFKDFDGPAGADNSRVTSREHHDDLQAVDACLEDHIPNCLIALDEHDEDNIRAATAAFKKDPKIPVVVHTFDPRFADLLEQSISELHIRRAYSMAGLAAPFFVAAALHQTNLLTMRLGDMGLPIARLEVGPHAPLAAAPQTVRAKHGVEVIAVKRPGNSEWSVVSGDDEEKPVLAGSHVLIGGRQADVVRCVYRNSSKRARRLAGWKARTDHVFADARAMGRAFVPSGGIAIALAVMAILITVTFGLTQNARMFDWPYHFVRTALGEQEFHHLKGLGTTLLLAGAFMFALVIGAVTSEKTTRKLRQDVRAQHLRDHVVIAGVGELGYRICTLLTDAKIGYAAIDPAPDDRFREAVKKNGAVIEGDIRLDENLVNAGIKHARAIIACSQSNLSNVEACIRAERQARGTKRERELESVARVFDDQIAESAGQLLGLNKTLAAVEMAAPAFVDAAVDETARRPFTLEDPQATPLPMIGQRLELNAPNSEQLEKCRRSGVHVIAWRVDPTRTDTDRVDLTPVEPPSESPTPGQRIAIAVVGTPSAVARFVAWAKENLAAETDSGGGGAWTRARALGADRAPATLA